MTALCVHAYDAEGFFIFQSIIRSINVSLEYLQNTVWHLFHH